MKRLSSVRISVKKPMPSTVRDRTWQLAGPLPTGKTKSNPSWMKPTDYKLQINSLTPQNFYF